MDYIKVTIYFVLFTLVFLILGYDFLYSHRVGEASQRLGISVPWIVKKLLNITIVIAFISLLIIGFFLASSITNFLF